MHQRTKVHDDPDIGVSDRAGRDPRTDPSHSRGSHGRNSLPGLCCEDQGPPGLMGSRAGNHPEHRAVVAAASSLGHETRVSSMLTMIEATRRPFAVAQTTLRYPVMSPLWPKALPQGVYVLRKPRPLVPLAREPAFICLRNAAGTSRPLSRAARKRVTSAAFETIWPAPHADGLTTVLVSIRVPAGNGSGGRLTR